MATQKVCDECGATEEQEFTTSQAYLLFKKGDMATDIRLNIGADGDYCNVCMAEKLKLLADLLIIGHMAPEKGKELHASRVQPK